MTRPDRTVLSDRQLKRYRELLRAADEDAVHELLVRHGPELLDRDLPYLIVASRNHLRSRMRRGAARFEISSPQPPEPAPAEPSIWDPLAYVVANETLRELARALGAMDPRDVLVVWGHAAGHSDREIAAQWNELGFAPASPSQESIRKRRQRANVSLRTELASLGYR